jgi:transcriptional regulator with XRE-family HTH domain/tetratricopeptide (TPR) repeat protein
MEGADILTFGEALARFRTRAGMSQKHLADKLGKNRRSIAAWERGDYLPKTKGDILELSRILTLNNEETILLLIAGGQDPSLSLWNIPHRRNLHFTGRVELLNQLSQHLAPLVQDHPTTTRRAALTQPQAIKGLGGIGKTQIAVEYAYRSREQGNYTHILWINSANEETLLTSFVELAELLPAFPAKSETDQHKLVAAVKRWLEDCKQRWLLIFDNADEVSLVNEYLPQRGNGSILLTTRANAVGSVSASSIEVERMSWIEGTHLLLRRAQRLVNASDEEVNEAGNIVVALDHFPLAIDQAEAYIEETQCSFVDYLALYQTHWQELLARRGKKATVYPHSVATTWSLSFQLVEQANPAAAEFLHLCAFLAPDRIPEELIQDGAAHWPPLLQQAATDLFLFDQILEDLLRFSLVKRLAEDHMLSIHRLVQAVQMERMGRDEQRQWAERIIGAVNEVFPRDSDDVATWPLCLRYLEQAQVCDTLIQQHMFVFPEAAELLERTADYLGGHASYTIAESLYRRALRIWEQELGPEHPDVADLLSNLAKLYDDQDKCSEAEPLYQRALRIWEQELGPEHPDVAYSLNGLANLYYTQGKYAEAEPLYHCAHVA